jgi:protein-arginine kinase activator protein McsA
MATEITLNNSDEFQQMVDRKDFIIAEAIVKSILININSRKNNVHVLSVNCLDDSSTYDITLDKKYFIETLQENLQHFVERELYEECSKIVNAIKQLEEKQHGTKTENTNTDKTKKIKKKTSGDPL